MGHFKYVTGDWTAFRKLEPPPEEVDFHYQEPREIPYWDAMKQIRTEALAAIKRAQEQGTKWVLFRHGASTSEGWQTTTARSQVRGLMRSKDATPYIIRSECIQHYSVFVARIRSVKNEGRGRMSGVIDGDTVETSTGGLA